MLVMGLILGVFIWGWVTNVMEEDARTRFKTRFNINLRITSGNVHDEEYLQQVRPYVLTVIELRRNAYQNAVDTLDRFLELEPATDAENAQERLAEFERLKKQVVTHHFAYYQSKKAAEAIPGLLPDQEQSETNE